LFLVPSVEISGQALYVIDSLSDHAPLEQGLMEEALGTVTIHPTVLTTVARLTSLATPGVARMSDEWRLHVERMLGRPGRGSGVDLSIKDNAVTVDLYVVAEPEVNLLRLGQTLQNEVSRAIQDMVGMEVSEVNVHIQDVDFPLIRSY
jgi:uncharacterized alkaline shock family protein YloU